MMAAPAIEVISPIHVAADTVHTPNRDAEVVLLDKVIASAAMTAAVTVIMDASMSDQYESRGWHLQRPV